MKTKVYEDDYYITYEEILKNGYKFRTHEAKICEKTNLPKHISKQRIRFNQNEQEFLYTQNHQRKEENGS